MRGDEIGSDQTVAVEENAQRTGASANAAVANLTAAKTAVLVAYVFERYAKARPPGGDDMGRFRPRAVIGNDDLEITIGLRSERAKHRLQRILAVEGRDDNRDESCVVQGPMLAGYGETVRIRLILHRLFLWMRALDDRRGRVAGHQTNQNDVTTGLFDDLAANHFVAGVVGALDEHRRPHAPD